MSSIIALLFGAFAILGTSFSPDGDDDQDGGDGGGTETDPILVTDSADITGTDGDDVFQADPTASDGLADVTLAAGAGDDTIILTDPSGAEPSFEWGIESSVIDGGDGDDTITATAPSSEIAGGDGNDVITVYNAAATKISGGEGNDTIGGTQFSADSTTITGGAGNDTIDAREMENVSAEGGEGNDTILVSGANQGGAGYVSSANGGAGDDTIRFEGSAITNSFFYQAQTATGGEGADRFEIAFDTGGALPDSDFIPSSTGTLTLEVFNVADFNPDEDILVLEPQTPDDGFVLAQGQLVENAEAGSTTIVLSYVSETEQARDLTFEIGATGLEWDGITFVGTPPPLLT